MLPGGQVPHAMAKGGVMEQFGDSAVVPLCCLRLAADHAVAGETVIEQKN